MFPGLKIQQKNSISFINFVIKIKGIKNLDSRYQNLFIKYECNNSLPFGENINE